MTQRAKIWVAERPVKIPLEYFRPEILRMRTKALITRREDHR